MNSLSARAWSSSMTTAGRASRPAATLLFAAVAAIVPNLALANPLDFLFADDHHDYWLMSLVLNVLGYATVVVPGYFIVRHFQKIKYNERPGHGCLDRSIKVCVFGSSPHDSPDNDVGRSSAKVERTFLVKAGLMVFCFLGLQGSYLTWGVLQERIMTQEYRLVDSPDEPGVKFDNTQFLVFLNRILALLIALVVVHVTHQPRDSAPLYKYSYCSISNVMSSWFQYEALKYVSFPIQLLCKASKIIPVMLMGRIVSKRHHEMYEYATALLLSAGIALFLFAYHDSDDQHQSASFASTTTVSGLILMFGYMAFDSYTSNWQGELFVQHGMTSMQMMLGVNIFSCLLTFIALLEQGTLGECIAFSMQYPLFLFHASLQAVASAAGQLFIYYTIAVFGPVAFATIMTIRMALAILLSCLIYHHVVSYVGYIGLVVVFVALGLQIYIGQSRKAHKSRLQKIPVGTAGGTPGNATAAV